MLLNPAQHQYRGVSSVSVERELDNAVRIDNRWVPTAKFAADAVAERAMRGYRPDLTHANAQDDFLSSVVGPPI